MSDGYADRPAAKANADSYTSAVNWANQLIAGTKQYVNVPADLKTKVNEVLRKVGHEDLIPSA